MANSKKGTKQVNPPGPKAQVAAKFGGKAQLVESILSALGDAADGSRGKLMQTSNSKLISHAHNTQRMVSQFGSKEATITAILAVRYPKGAPDGERTKLEAFSPWRLMDQHRQAVDGAARAQVLAEQKAKAKIAKAKRHGRTPAAAAAPAKTKAKKK
jgi:hypothetical protein